MEKLSKYITPIADIYAYCLLSNHFHLLLRFKDNNGNSKDAHQTLMKPFSNMLNAYNKNIIEEALFLDFLKRKRVDNENYLLNLCIIFIIIQTWFDCLVENWNFSSYRSYLDLSKSSKLKEMIFYNTLTRLTILLFS